MVHKMREVKILKDQPFGNDPEETECSNIKATYQPIVNLSSGETIGWEAFTRINDDNCFRFLYNIPSHTEATPFSTIIDKNCFENAIQKLGRIHSKHKVFLNIQPQSFQTSAFAPERISDFIEKYGIKPFQVVFELSSRNSFQNDLSFWNQIDKLKNFGIQFALDDVGSGQSDFRWIADLKPQYIKLDRQFYQNALSETIMKALLESLVTFCKQTNICMIAERLENLTEIELLVDMGIQYGQGYYLARPNFPKKQAIAGYSIDIVKPSNRVKKCQLMKCNLPIEKYLRQVPIVQRKTTVLELKKIVSLHTHVTAVVMDKGKVAGVLENQHVYQILCQHKEDTGLTTIDLAKFMEQNFFVAESEMSVVDVVKMIAKQNMGLMNPPIVVTSNSSPIGTVSFVELQEVFIRYQIDEARDANPLTGLPGNMAIQQAIDEYYRIGQPLSLIYIDLDHFKVFNDQYGFKRGDQMLLQLSQILSWAIKRKGGEGDFLGHIGGDDFVIITAPEKAVGICQLVIKSFSRLRNGCYDIKEIKQGYVDSHDRKGLRKQAPLAAVSLAIVDCNERKDIAELPERAASMKQYAKTISGNSYVLDRRKTVDRRLQEG
ncbi:MAG: EAL domain-containing protein [Deltaproteobacteria bacterium]|nr:MAG: EAL domain-containing protein [Deltaproteobacteria bacterium]